MRARACTGNEVFTGGGMLPTRPYLDVKELRVSRVLAGAAFLAANLGGANTTRGHKESNVPVNP